MNYVCANIIVQTDPLPKPMHEMDDIKQAGPLFEKGLEMLKTASFKNLLKGIFGPEFTVADELLNILCDQIRGEVNGIDIFDSKPLTMVSIIDDFINEGAVDRANLEAFFSQRLERAGLGDISNLNATQLSALMKWTHALLAENQKHKGDRTFPQKAATGVKGVFGYLASSLYVANQESWEGLHDKISRLIQEKKDECLKQIVMIMRNKKTQVVETCFNTTENIRALIRNVVHYATPTSTLKFWADATAKDEAICAQSAFEEHLLKPLGVVLADDTNDTDYLTLVYWLLEEVKIHVCEGQSGSWGLRRAVKNSVRTMAGQPVYMSRHQVLYGKIVELQNTIKRITASPLLIDSDEADSFEFASEEGSLLESATQSE